MGDLLYIIGGLLIVLFLAGASMFWLYKMAVTEVDDEKYEPTGTDFDYLMKNIDNIENQRTLIRLIESRDERFRFTYACLEMIDGLHRRWQSPTNRSMYAVIVEEVYDDDRPTLYQFIIDGEDRWGDIILSYDILTAVREVNAVC